MQRVFYNGKEVIYTDIGEGDPIILLHGYLGSSRIWFNLARNLSAGFRVISIDLPGHGLSEVHSERHSMEFLAGAVLEVINSAEINDCIMVGHSLGGYVTLAALEMYPERIKGYCLFHSHPFADNEVTIKKRVREIKAVNAGKKNLLYPDNVERMYAPHNLEKFKESLTVTKHIASQNPGRGIIAMLNGMITRPSRTELVEKGDKPLLWILGKFDSYIDHREVTDKITLPGNARVALMEHSGHLGFIEEEEKAAQLISQFAREIFAD